MSAASGLAGHVGVSAACRALGVARATFYRRRRPKPEVVARTPDEVWSWDITRLLGPEKWQYLYLYVILDIYSRYATGWMVAERETAGLAGHLVGETCLRHG
ncbi:MAG: DDE-type integrase/transposase/recombinase, partial [Gemmatimonadetes bacterium]|nr:DDE-type integrase/transposase/recombinase [Gemmatimonadota bacterium]